MTSDFYCILIMALMPYMLTSLAKFTSERHYNNYAPRVFLNKLTDWRQRANWAQNNCYEIFPFFSVAIIIAHLRNAPQTTLNLLAISFIILRIFYAIFYITNIAYWRSLAWFASVACIISMFFI